MKLLSSEEYLRLLANESDSKQLKKDHKREVKEFKEEIETLEKRLEKEIVEKKALESLNNDALKTRTKSLELDQREKIVDQQEKNLEKREKAVTVKEDAKYKSGYEDGVADGLRKGYDLTAQDRQNMASIAALAAASHSDGATQKIAEEIVIGLQGGREIPAKASKK